MKKKDLTTDVTRRLFVLHYCFHIKYEKLVKEFHLSEKVIREAIKSFILSIYEKYQRGVPIQMLKNEYNLNDDQFIVLFRIGSTLMDRFTESIAI